MENTNTNKYTPLVLKTYVLQFIYPNGNGWAFVNGTSVTQAESVFYRQTRYEKTKVTSIQETRWFGNNTQLVYEGSVTTCADIKVTISLSDLIKNTDAYSSVEEYLNSVFNFDNYYNKDEVNTVVQDKVKEALKDIELPDLNLDDYVTKEQISDYVAEEIDKIDLPKDGADGKDGIDGKNGEDGIGIANVIYEGTNRSGGINVLKLVLSDGTIKGPYNIYNGKDGESSTVPTPVINPSVVEVTEFGGGSFEDAWDKAKSDPENMFQWWLSDTDDFGNSINKIIWHIGNKQFKDALGSTIVGKLSGLTITCNKPCVMHILTNEGNNTRKHVLADLTTGINNFTFEELGTMFTEAGCVGSPQNINSINFFEEGTTITNAVYDHDSVTAIDFGGITVTSTTGSSAYKKEEFLRGQTALKTITGLVLTNGANVCGGCTNLVSASVSGTISGAINLFEKCNKLTNLNIQNLNISNVSSLSIVKADYDPNGSTSSANKYLPYGRLRELDLTSLDTSGMTTIVAFLTGCGNLEKLTIGNFTTESVTSAAGCLTAVIDSILVCTTTTPPVLGYDWIKKHFRRIYVPENAVSQYKAAWSNYATIIYSISDYNE